MRLRKPSSRASRRSKSRSGSRPRPAARARPAGRREAAKDRYGKAASSFTAIARRSAIELWGIGREMVRIPTALFMRVAEIIGAWVLRGWLLLWPVLVAAWRLAGRGLRLAQRVVTPARAVVLVALLTAVALAGSQWADLRGITIGTNNYIGLEEIAPPPQVETQTVGSSHSWLGLPLAILAIVVVVGSARGRPKLARLLVAVGAAVVAISLLVDRPNGLDKGQLDIQYESVTATLLTGFWAQLVSGVVLILLAPLLIRTLSGAPTTSSLRTGPKPARLRMPSFRGSKGPRRPAEAQQ